MNNFNLGSPFECHIVDSAKIKVHGSGIERVPVNCPASFTIDTGSVDIGEVHCTILGKFSAFFLLNE